jgi:hypothetical protein
VIDLRRPTVNLIVEWGIAGIGAVLVTGYFPTIS